MTSSIVLSKTVSPFSIRACAIVVNGLFLTLASLFNKAKLILAGQMTLSARNGVNVRSFLYF